MQLSKHGQAIKWLINEAGFTYNGQTGQVFKPDGTVQETHMFRGLRSEYLVFTTRNPFVSAQIYVHKLASYCLYGEAALYPGIQARHKDGNRLNNKSDNILIGTQKENMADNSSEWRSDIVKKRQQTLAIRRQARGRSRFMDDEVRSIRQALANGVKVSLLTRTYAVHRRTIYDIGHWRTYKHVMDSQDLLSGFAGV
jgi:hypothetical protein